MNVLYLGFHQPPITLSVRKMRTKLIIEFVTKLPGLAAPELFLAVLLLPSPGWAGICTAEAPGHETRHDFEFSAGYSPASATFIGTTSDERFVMAGFSYSYRCWVWENVSISYTGGLLPAATLLGPAMPAFLFSRGRTVYGFGISPLGFRFDFGRRHRLYTFLQTDEGIVASTEPIPFNVPGGTGLNFLID